MTTNSNLTLIPSVVVSLLDLVLLSFTAIILANGLSPRMGLAYRPVQAPCTAFEIEIDEAGRALIDSKPIGLEELSSRIRIELPGEEPTWIRLVTNPAARFVSTVAVYDLLSELELAEGRAAKIHLTDGFRRRASTGRWAPPELRLTQRPGEPDCSKPGTGQAP